MEEFFLEAVLLVGRRILQWRRGLERMHLETKVPILSQFLKARGCRRVPLLDVAFDEVEIRHVEKLKISKIAAGDKDLEEESSEKQKQIYRDSKNSKPGEILEDFVSPRSTQDSKIRKRI